MPSLLAQQAASLGGDLASAGLGLLLERHQDKRQIKQQGKLLDQQYNYDNMMANANYARSLQMWHDTNYSAQMAEIEKAGLNPAMLYGMSGGGATTANAPTGNVNSAKASSESQIPNMIALGIQTQQLGLLKAQKENIEADTQNKKAQTQVAGATVGKIGAETKNIETDTKLIEANIKNTDAQREVIEIQRSIMATEDYIKGKTQNSVIRTIQYQVEEAREKVDLLKNQNKISANEAEYAERMSKANLANVVINTWKQSEEAKLATQMARESVERISDMINDNYMQADEQSNRNQEQRRETEKWINEQETPQLIKEALQALGLWALLKGGKTTHTPIEGFRKRH